MLKIGLRGALNRVFLDLLTGLGLGLDLLTGLGLGLDILTGLRLGILTGLGLDILTGLGQLGGGRCCKRETSGKLLQSPNRG